MVCAWRGPSPNPSPKWEGGHIPRCPIIPGSDANAFKTGINNGDESKPPSHLGVGLGVGPHFTESPKFPAGYTEIPTECPKYPRRE